MRVIVCENYEEMSKKAAQIVAGIIIGRVPLVIICVIAYVAATVALQFMTKKEETSPKA